jgi:hypothetical protein
MLAERARAQAFCTFAALSYYPTLSIKARVSQLISVGYKDNMTYDLINLIEHNSFMPCLLPGLLALNLIIFQCALKNQF